MSQFFAARAAAMLLFAAAASAQAATYYVDSSAGNDANNGTTTSSPWKTLSKVNSSVTSGDTVKLLALKVWREPLIIKSGVTYTSYGSTSALSRAIISGSRPVNGLTWTRFGASTSNIWVATTNAQIESGNISQLFVSGTKQTRARTPNVGSGDFAVTSSRYARIAQNGNGTTLNINVGVVPASRDINGATVFSRNRGSELTEYRVASSTLNGSGQAVTLGLSHVSLLDDWGVYNDYSLDAGYGYWLENKLWMLDSPGEWYFDAAAHKLYVWLKDNAQPTASSPSITVASQANGIVANNVSNFSLSNIQVQETTSDAISMNQTSGASLDNLLVLRAGRRGISMADSQNNTISNSFIDRSWKEGVWLGFVSRINNPVPPLSRRSINVSVTNTQVTNAGTGGFASGVVLGEGGAFSGNVVSGSSSGGVITTLNNRVENNQVTNNCTDFDDCGGIYVVSPPSDPTLLSNAQNSSPSTPITKVLLTNGVIINNNVVDGGKGSADGVPASGGTDTRGIYLDDYANGVTVTNNYVSGMKYGIMLHTAFNNTLSDNRLLSNRSQNLLLQAESVPSVDGNIRYWGVMTGNVIKHNAMVASKDASSPTLAIPNIKQSAEDRTGKGPTGAFAAYDLNRYASLNPNATAILAYNYGTDVPVADMTLAAWLAIKNDLQGTFYPYKTTAEAWGFYNPIGAGNSANSTKQISSITGSTTPTGTFTNLLTGLQVTLPVVLQPGESIVLIK
jgi:parallel beta-helix repeat protein